MIRHAPERRLDTECPGRRSRGADRAGRIRSERDRAHPGSRSSRRAAAGATRRHGRIPGIARGPAQGGPGRSGGAEFGYTGLAEQHTARFTHTRHGRRIDRPGALRGDRPAAASRRPARSHGKILDRVACAIECTEWLAAHPARLARACLAQGAFEIQPAEGVEYRIQPLDGLDDGLDTPRPARVCAWHTGARSRPPRAGESSFDMAFLRNADLGDRRV